MNHRTLLAEVGGAVAINVPPLIRLVGRLDHELSRGVLEIVEVDADRLQVGGGRGHSLAGDRRVTRFSVEGDSRGPPAMPPRASPAK
jgi:hypothetical protein